MTTKQLALKGHGYRTVAPDAYSRRYDTRRARRSNGLRKLTPCSLTVPVERVPDEVQET